MNNIDILPATCDVVDTSGLAAAAASAQAVADRLKEARKWSLLVHECMHAWRCLS